MAIRHRKNLRLVSKRGREHIATKKHTIGNRHEHDVCINERSQDGMTEEDFLAFYLGSDNMPIPDEVFDILNRRVVDCLKANNIPIPDYLRKA